jgi:hypothetical protein
MGLTTSGSLITFSDMTGSNLVATGITPVVGTTNKFIVMYNDQRITPTKTVARVITWDGTTNGFSSGSEYSSSLTGQVGAFSGGISTNRPGFVSGSRYANLYLSYSNSWNALNLFTVDSSGTGSVNWISTTENNYFTYPYVGDWCIIDSQSGVAGLHGFNASFGSFYRTVDMTGSINTIALTNTGAYTTRTRHITIWTGVTNEYIGFGPYSSPNTQFGRLITYTPSTNTIAVGSAEFFTFGPGGRNVINGVKPTSLYRFDNDTILVAETTNSSTAGQIGVWMNFIARNGDVFSPRASQAYIISASAGSTNFTDVNITQLNAFYGTYAITAVAQDGRMYWRKVAINPYTDSVTPLGDIGSASISLFGYWGATRLDDDTIAVAYSNTNVHKLFSIRFNAPYSNSIQRPGITITGLQSLRGIQQIQYA